MRSFPLATVRHTLSSLLEPHDLERLPQGYQRIGDVLVLDLPLPGPEAVVAEAYARALDARSVLGKMGGIEGEFREPRLRLLWGDPHTETIHVENGLRFRLDPARIMWSAGNLAERQRVASWDLKGQTVVDCFAGVGYLSIPAAARARAARVVAIEKNPVAHGYLVQNAALNGVTDVVEARLGDCRDRAPTAVADIVLLGYLPDALEFVPVALRALKPQGGRIHVHRAVSTRAPLQRGFDAIERVVAETGAQARLLHVERVKSYAPTREHCVFDVEVTR